jgi:hypothetical protein
MSPLAWAGFFDGDVNVVGTLTKGAGAFRSIHPLDPENKYLSHSFVESPDMKNIYDGVAVFDQAGEAIVTLPDWFEALNEDFRYQLTPMGAAFVPFVAEEIAATSSRSQAASQAGRFLAGDGIRHDAYANAHRIPVEELKPAAAMGTYLHPEAFGQLSKGCPALRLQGDRQGQPLGEADAGDRNGRSRSFARDSSAYMAPVLLIGLDPRKIAGFDPAPVELAIALGHKRCVDAGVEVDTCLVEIGPTARAIIAKALQAKPYGVVIIGGGIRKPDDSSSSSRT